MMRPINVFISSFVFFYCYFEFLGVFSGYEVKLFNSDLDFQDFIIIIIIFFFFGEIQFCQVFNFYALYHLLVHS